MDCKNINNQLTLICYYDYHMVINPMLFKVIKWYYYLPAQLYMMDAVGLMPLDGTWVPKCSQSRCSPGGCHWGWSG